MKPLLPAIDRAGQLREVAFALLLGGRRAVEPTEIANVLGIPTRDVQVAIGELAQAGWLDVEEDRVVGAAGLSLVNGPHRLRLAGGQFRNWCAYDSLGIAAALSADARVDTACGHCGAPISITFANGVPERIVPEVLWLADGGADLRGSFCTPTVLLCGSEHGQVWSHAQGGRGRLLDLVDAARIGAEDWAGCSRAAERLA